MSPTLFRYITRRFLGTLAAALMVVMLLIILIDLVELMRRGSDTDASFGDLLVLALLHALSVANTTFPFVFMLAAMACFGRLARTSELVVTRAAGVSVWKLLLPVVLTSACLGVLAFSVYNPISAATLSRFETLEARYFRGQESLLSVSREGLWLRQGGRDDQTVIRARRSNAQGTELEQVSLFRFGPQNTLLSRIEAARADLGDHVWSLTDVHRWTFDPENPDASPVRDEAEEAQVPTDLTSNHILESFASPDAIGFWDLPDFIEALRASGFSTLRHEMHFQTELAKPLLYSAMVLIGAAFSMRHVRFGGIGLMLVGATLTGFALFFVSDITQALGASGAIPTLIAAWVPPAAAMLLALGLLFYLEDG
ncbi:LPS export ABC transporter permease LptG [Oceanicella sp. SM1341]|uniref:LPS export ABC transporter permease LptG n=1 Tax=Oceanicella sp. SM1341 TaxID=1548889 RepID=UPI00130073A8|nr:LPS export ABC transporter permease LptG [Oceanicella sp. SM1341]